MFYPVRYRFTNKAAGALTLAALRDGVQPTRVIPGEKVQPGQFFSSPDDEQIARLRAASVLGEGVAHQVTAPEPTPAPAPVSAPVSHGTENIPTPPPQAAPSGGDTERPAAPPMTPEAARAELARLRGEGGQAGDAAAQAPSPEAAAPLATSPEPPMGRKPRGRGGARSKPDKGGRGQGGAGEGEPG